MAEVGLGETSGTQWKFWKFVEEPDFGPGIPIHTVYITGKLGPDDGVLKGLCWSTLIESIIVLFWIQVGCIVQKEIVHY